MEFNYSRNAEIKGRAVVKISAGNWFVITKTGSFKFICDEINAMYKRYAFKREGIRSDSLYFEFVHKCYTLGLTTCKIEVLYQSENGYEILKKELELLVENFGKRYCLNSNNTPYVPKTTRATTGSNWLKPNEYLNFMRLLKTYDY